MDSTAGVSSMRNQAQEGTTLLPRMDPAGAEPSEWELAKKETPIFLGLDSKGGDGSSMQKQAVEGIRVRQADEKLFRLWKESTERRHLNDIIVDGVWHRGKTYQEAMSLLLESSSALRARQADEESKESARLWKESMERRHLNDIIVAGVLHKGKTHEEAMSLLLQSSLKRDSDLRAAQAVLDMQARRAAQRKKSRKLKYKDRAKANAMAKKAKDDEVHVPVGSSKSAMEDEVMGKEISQQLLRDPDCDDGKDEMIDRGKSVTEEENMPSVRKNPSDRVEESVTAWNPLLCWEQALLEFPGVDFTWIPERFCFGFIRKFIGKMKRPPESLDIQIALAAIQASFGNSTRIGGKSVIDEVISPETEESGTEAVKKAEEGVLLVGPSCLEPLMAKKAQEGGLLVGRDSTAYMRSTLRQAAREFRRADFSWIPFEFWLQFNRKFRITMKREPEYLDIQNALAAIEANFGNSTRIGGKTVIDEVISPETEESGTEAVKEAEEGVLLVGMDSTGGESLTRKEAEEAVEELWQIKQVEAMEESMPEAVEESMSAGGLELAKERNMKTKTRQDEEAGKAEASLRDAGRPEESVTEAGKAEEAVMVGSSISAAEVMGKETMQQLLLKDMSNRFAILDDLQEDEIVRGKLAIEDEHMPSDGMNPSDRGEESVTVGSGKSVVDPAEEGGALVLVGMDSTGGMSSAMRKKTEESGKRTQVHDISMNSSAIEEGHTPSTVQSGNKLLLQPADPSTSNWMTRLVRVQDDLHHYRGNWKTADEEMAFEAEDFAEYRSCWETAWRTTCGSFDYMTALSSMQFTYYTPGRTRYNYAASTPPTLQIVSIKLAEIAGGLRWPLSVYGVVAIRDVVDRNRNFLFSCHSGQSQELTQDDPFLRLVGPSRAVVFEDRINIEMELKVKDPTGSQDKPLITQAWDYHEPFNNVSTFDFKNCFCTIELCMQVVRKTIQATILGVQVVGDGPWPFKYGARVTCSPVPGKPGTPNNPESGEIVMVNSKDEAKLYGSDGYLHLQRNVISVETEGRLDVHIQAYSKSGKMFAKKHVRFLPQFSKISQRHCFVRGAEVEITVAWSLVATNKDTFMVLGRNSCAS